MAPLAVGHDRIRCLVPFGNILAITGGVRSGQKVPNGKSQTKTCNAGPPSPSSPPRAHRAPPKPQKETSWQGNSAGDSGEGEFRGEFALRFGESGRGNSEGNSVGIQGEFALCFGEFAPATARETPIPAVRGLLMSCTESSFYNIKRGNRHLQASRGASPTRSGSSSRLPFDAF